MRVNGKSLRILFAAGGTGGHLYPALAIAEEMKALQQQCEIIFVGTAGKIEATVVPKRGYPFFTIWISGFHRRLTMSNLLFPLKVIVAVVQSYKLLKSWKPAVVVGTGGYVCGPILYVASLMKIPTVIHESNSYPGVTTRMLASRVTNVLLAFDATRQWLAKGSVAAVTAGNPTRSILGTISRRDALAHYGLDESKKTVLVFGGSLGAASINTAVKKIYAELLEDGMQLIWQTGNGQYEELSQVIKHPSIKVMAYIEQMEYAYAAADLVISRSGATTVAELTRLGKPAILVPYPFAAANHQQLNAETVVREGGAILISDAELENRLSKEIRELIHDDQRCAAMSKRSRALGKPDAGSEIAQIILRMVGKGAVA